MWFRIWQRLGKHFLHPAGCGSVFPSKSCQDAWRNGHCLVRGQVNMVDEAKFCSPIHSTFEVLVVQCVIWHCHGEELGPSCWPMLTSGLAVFIASHQFAEHTSWIKWFWPDSESCSGSDRQQTTKQWPWTFFFGANLALGSV